MNIDKITIGYSPLTEEIYLGTTNPKKPGVWGDKRNITSRFIGVMLQKFEPGYAHAVEEVETGKAYRITVEEVAPTNIDEQEGK